MQRRLVDPEGRVDGNLIRVGLPVGYDARAIAANNLTLLHEFPDPGVPQVVIDGQIIDDDDWLSRIPA